MTRTVFALGMLFVLAGCSTLTPNMTNKAIHNQCYQVPFQSYADCFESRLDRESQGWRGGREAALWTLYLEWARSAAKLVAQGKVTEFDAKTAAVNFHAELSEISQEIYWSPDIAASRMRTLSPPDFRPQVAGGAPALSCTSIALGGGIADIQCH